MRSGREDLPVTTTRCNAASEYDAAVARLHEELDVAALTAAWAEGARLAIDDAVAFALATEP